MVALPSRTPLRVFFQIEGVLLFAEALAMFVIMIKIAISGTWALLEVL
jgi:hypothetical protein